MVMRAIRLVGLGVVVGVAADRILLELRKPAAEQFPWLRERMNDTVNPWLLEHGIPGSERAEIGTLEHIGRTSGTVHLTPVHPTLRGDVLLVPAPLGVGSQWARNVLHAGHARLQLHDTLYELDRPEQVFVAETGLFPPPVAAPFDRMGWRYVRFHVAATVPGSFTRHAPAAEAAALHEEAPLDEPFTIPVGGPAGAGAG